jgi:hypothetical protein
MNRRSAFVLVCVFLAAITWLTLNGGSPAADSPGAPGLAPVQKWEYQIRKRLDEAVANELGAEGWELCAAANTDDREDHPGDMRYIFKRPVR